MKRRQFYILLVVARGPVHGAEIRRRVSEETEGEVTLYPVTLYRSLDELTAAGLIEEAPDPEPDEHNEKRRYYMITDRGRQALIAEAEVLSAAARMARSAIEAGGAG